MPHALDWLPRPQAKAATACEMRVDRFKRINLVLEVRHQAMTRIAYPDVRALWEAPLWTV